MLTRILLASAVLFLSGCGKREKPLSEVETEAGAILSKAFKERDHSWFAAIGNIGKNNIRRPTLVELRNPSVALSRRTVTSTDKLNGIEARYVLIVECENMRTWDGSWTEWKAGTAGQAARVNALIPGGAGGYWNVLLEKKHGDWSAVPDPIPKILFERETREDLMVWAGIE